MECVNDNAVVNICGVKVDAVNMQSAQERILDAVKHEQKGYVCVTGAHGVLESNKDESLRLIHNQSLLTVPDGMPNVWIGRMRGHKGMGRVYGPDLMLELCRESVQKKKTHFFYGATPDTLRKLTDNLGVLFPGIGIAGTYAPPFRDLTDHEERELELLIAECKPDFFWVGLSTPKQERFMADHCGGKGADLNCGVMLGVGAAFDFHAGNITDAPKWMKSAGLQWLHRLCCEPRRLWRRYLYIVPMFIWLNLLQMVKAENFDLIFKSSGKDGE